MKLEDFADKKPEFKLEEFFLGKTTASGLFIDLFGKVKRQFTVEMEGIQQGDVFILNETFLYPRVYRVFRLGICPRSKHHLGGQYGQRRSLSGRCLPRRW